jgi:hypothetical protein
MSDLLCVTCLREQPTTTDESCIAVTILDGMAVCRAHALDLLERHQREETEHVREEKVARYSL